MAGERQRDALETIFSMFLGLMVVGFIGVGVNTFYPSSAAPTQIWTSNTSIILVVFATAVMGISLVRSEQLKVVSNGLLLGGLFTMFYGVGLDISSPATTLRFLVIGFALLVTLGLGYVKFVRRRSSVVAPPAVVVAAPRTPARAPSGDIELRVAALEARIEAAADLLGAPHGPGGAER